MSAGIGELPDLSPLFLRSAVKLLVETSNDAAVLREISATLAPKYPGAARELRERAATIDYLAFLKELQHAQSR